MSTYSRQKERREEQRFVDMINFAKVNDRSWLNFTELSLSLLKEDGLFYVPNYTGRNGIILSADKAKSIFEKTTGRKIN